MKLELNSVFGPWLTLWLCQRSFYCPSLPKPGIYTSIVNLKPFAQISKTGCNSKNRKNFYVSSVSALCQLVRPSYISRLVSLIIVNAINLHSFRAFAHIFQKVLERFKPSVAYLNSPSAVKFISVVSWIIASLNHARPASVCLGSGKSVLKVSIVSLAITAAMWCETILKREVSNNLYGAAFIAATEASCNYVTTVGFVRWNIFYNFPISKLPSYYTFSYKHNIGSIIVVFSGRSRLSPAPSVPFLTSNN